MKLETRRPRLAVCNLCNANFRRKSIYTRFCNTCRKENEVYRFADSWSWPEGRSGGVDSVEMELLPLSDAWIGA